VELHPPPTPPPGATFDGRDRFAPAAGRLARGTPINDLGQPFDPATLAGAPIPAPGFPPGAIVAEVLWIDRFGNAQLNLTPADTGQDPLRLGSVRLPILRSYRDIGPDQYALVVDSYGYLAICADQAPAARRLGLRAGDQVHLARETQGHQ
jgi:S-adenosylmethionine hydrolase